VKGIKIYINKYIKVLIHVHICIFTYKYIYTYIYTHTVHQRRLNVLANVMRKPMEEMLYEFMEGTIAADAEGLLQGSGDVKYHLGFTMVVFHSSIRLIHM